jgi:enoyl-CoA hydratase
LTGARLDGAECLWAGLATHYLASERLPEAKARIVEAPGGIGAILAELSSAAPEPRIAGNADRIDRLFAAGSLEHVIAALRADPSEWAAKELKAVAAKCPATSKVALREFAEGARRTDFADEMRAEYRIAARMMLRPDFAEGVRAVLIDKDNTPRWQPADLAGVTKDIVDRHFAPVANDLTF